MTTADDDIVEVSYNNLEHHTLSPSEKAVKHEMSESESEDESIPPITVTVPPAQSEDILPSCSSVTTESSTVRKLQEKIEQLSREMKEGMDHVNYELVERENKKNIWKETAEVEKIVSEEKVHKHRSKIEERKRRDTSKHRDSQEMSRKDANSHS